MADQVIIEFVGDTQQLQPAIDILQQLGQIDAKTADSFRKTNQELSKRSAALQQVATEEEKHLKTFDDIIDKVMTSGSALVDEFVAGMMDGLEEAGVSVEEFSQMMGGLNVETQELANSQEPLKKQLRSLTQEMAALKVAGQDNTAEYEALREKAGELKDAIGDVQEEIAQAGSDTRGFDHAIRVANLGIGAFTAFQGVMGMMGVENEKVQATLLNVNSAMAVLNGLQAIQAELARKDSVAKAALTKVQLVYNWAVGQGTIALKAFRLAVLATGVGALVVGLGWLISKFSDTKDKADDATDSLNNFKRAIDYLAGSMETDIDLIGKRADLAIEKAKQRGATEAEIFKMQQKRMSDEKAAVDQHLTILQKAYDEAYKNKRVNNMQEIGKLLADTQKRSQNLEHQMLLESEKEKTRIAEKARQAAKENANKYLDVIKAQLEEEKAEKLNHLLALEKNGRKEEQAYIDQLKSIEQTQAKIDLIGVKGINKKALILAESLQKQEQIQKDFDLKQLENANRTSVLLLESKLAQVEKGSDEEVKLRKQLLEEQARVAREGIEATITDENLKAAEILAINSKLAEELLEIDNEQKAKRLNFQADIKNLEAEAEIIVQERELLKARLIKNEEEKENAIKAINEKIQSIRLAGIDREIALNVELYTEGLVSKEEFETKRLELTNKRAKAEIDIAKEQADKEIEIEKEKLAKQQELRELIVEKGLEIANQISDSMFEVGSAKRKKQLEEELESLDKRKDKELDNKNLTEQQKADIEARYQEKMDALKKKDAEDEKKAKIAQARINGMLAVTNILATRPKFDFGIGDAIMIAATLASMEIQVQKIKALPAFKKGTKNAPSGYALVGEEGPEIVKLAGGEKIYKYSDTRKVLEAWRGGSIASADEILGLGSLPSADKKVMSDYSVTKGGKIEIDYNKLAKTVAKELAGVIPETAVLQNTIDSEGLHQFVIKGKSKMEVKNKHFRMLGG